uniref:Uncharacterized protein n=1 Tax=Rhizophora mucronata TaxID=61149 RepID=A0A2P2QF20_RHIMU
MVLYSAIHVNSQVQKQNPARILIIHCSSAVLRNDAFTLNVKLGMLKIQDPMESRNIYKECNFHFE